MFEEDIDGTMAHDIMLHEQGILEREDLALILGALQEIKEEWKAGRGHPPIHRGQGNR